MEKELKSLIEFDSTKNGIERFVKSVVSEIREGNYNPLRLKIFLKAIKKCCEEIEKQTDDLSLAEAEKSNLRSFKVNGAKVELAELGTKYDFNNCNHPQLSIIEEKIKVLSDQKKSIETFLKTVSKSMVICNEDTGGESVEINPPIKSSISGLKITLQ